MVKVVPKIRPQLYAPVGAAATRGRLCRPGHAATYGHDLSVQTRSRRRRLCIYISLLSHKKAPLGSLRRGFDLDSKTPYLRPFTQVSTSPFTLSLAKP